MLLTHLTANELLRQNGYFAGVENGSLGSLGIFEQLVFLNESIRVADTRTAFSLHMMVRLSSIKPEGSSYFEKSII